MVSVPGQLPRESEKASKLYLELGVAPHQKGSPSPRMLEKLTTWPLFGQPLIEPLIGKEMGSTIHQTPESRAQCDMRATLAGPGPGPVREDSAAVPN